MKIASILWMFFIGATLGYGQNMSNSIGVVTIDEDFYNQEVGLIRLLNDDGTTWYEFSFYYDDTDGQWDFPNDQLDILAFHPDYFLFKIKCLNETDEYYEVVVNEATQLCKRLAKSPEYKLLTWEQYALDVFAVDFDRSIYSIYTYINGPVSAKEPDQESILTPVEISGDWMKIRWSDVYQQQNPDDVHFGWIRWKEGNKILVELYHLS